eukprot:tig00020848_g14551.t1
MPPATPELDAEARLLSTVDVLGRIAAVVEEFSPERQPLLLKQIHELIGQYEKLQQLSHRIPLQIPVQVLGYVDDGRNPNQFTRDLIARCVESNQRTKGKVEGLSLFRAALEAEIQKE